jgi:hypothetical protein
MSFKNISRKPLYAYARSKKNNSVRHSSVNSRTKENSANAKANFNSTDMSNSAAFKLVSEPSIQKKYHDGFDGDERYNLRGYTLDDIQNNRMSVDWDTYLIPNELCPKSSRHLMEEAFLDFKLRKSDDDKKGYIISVGTERCLFDLLYADEYLCDGLIIIDVNPKVKMYMDWIIHCLNESDNREDFNKNLTKLEPVDLYLKYCSLVYNGTLPGKTDIELFNETPMSRNDKMWRFYKSIIESEVNYWDNDILFGKLKRYARKENGIRTYYGSVDNLTFLKNVNIIFVDTSNVHNYKFLYFLLGEGVNLYNVIHMNMQGMCGYYYTIRSPFNTINNPSFNDVWDFIKPLSEPSEPSEFDKYKKLNEFFDNKKYQLDNKIAMLKCYEKKLEIKIDDVVFLTNSHLEIFKKFKKFFINPSIDFDYIFDYIKGLGQDGVD